MQYTCKIKFLVKKKTAEAGKWKIPYLLFTFDSSYQGCFTIYSCMFIPHTSLSQEWHFSQLKQGRTAPKSHQPTWRKASCIGWEEKEEFTRLQLLSLPSLLGRAGMVLFMQPQTGWKRGGTGPNLDLGNYCNGTFVCHFKYDILIYF